MSRGQCWGVNLARLAPGRFSLLKANIGASDNLLEENIPASERLLEDNPASEPLRPFCNPSSPPTPSQDLSHQPTCHYRYSELCTRGFVAVCSSFCSVVMSAISVVDTTCTWIKLRKVCALPEEECCARCGGVLRKAWRRCVGDAEVHPGQLQGNLFARRIALATRPRCNARCPPRGWRNPDRTW